MKSKTKRILAFLCAVILFVTTVFTENAMRQAEAEDSSTAKTTSTEPVPVELYGFENVTLNGLVGATDKSVMTDKEYVNGESQYRLKSDTDFDKKLFTAWVKFTDPDTENNYRNRICIGGAGGSAWGLSVSLSNDGESLLVWDAAGATIANPQIYKPIEGSDVKVDSFLGETFLLQMGYEYLDYDKDGNKNDVRILVYVNGNEGLNTVVKDCDMTTLGNYVIVSILNDSKIQIESVDLPVKPVTLEGFKNITISDLNTKADGSGSQMQQGPYTYRPDVESFYYSGEENFDNTLLSLKVKYEYDYENQNAWETRIYVAGTGGWTGLGIDVSNDGKTLGITDQYQVSDNWDRKVSASEAGVDDFWGEFFLQLSFKYITADENGTENDLELGVYINGNLCQNQPLYFYNCDMDRVGNSVVLRRGYEQSVITVYDLIREAEPIRLSGFDTITVSDFQDASGTEMESKAYAYDATTPDATFTLKNTGDNFANKLLSMKVKFGYESPEAAHFDTRMVIGADDLYHGIFVYVNSEDKLCIDNKSTDASERITAAEAGVSSFLNTPFILQMFFVDTSDGLNVGIFINGTLCETFEWSGVTTSQYTNKMHLRRALEDSFITVNSIDEDEFPEDPRTEPDPTFTKLTFGSFGIIDGTYQSGTYEGEYEKNIDKTAIYGKVKLSEYSQILVGGHSGSTWNGIRLIFEGSKKLNVKWYEAIDDETGEQIQEIIPSEIGKNGRTSFFEEDIDLIISTEFVALDNDGKVNDIKLGIWFDGYLYQDDYLYIKDRTVMPTNLFGFYSSGDVTVNSVKEYLPQPDESYEKVTFSQFGIKDDTYKYLGEKDIVVVKGSIAGTEGVDKKVVCGKVLFEGSGEFQLLLGGTDAWNGLHLYVNEDHSATTMKLLGLDSQEVTSFDAGKAGLTSFVGGDGFELMWSVEEVGTNLKVGVWFNGFLYGNEYITISDCNPNLGNVFAAACSEDGASITLGSMPELTKLPERSLNKVTFSDFVHDGTENVIGSSTFLPTQDAAGNPDFAVKGNAKKFDSLVDKVLAFDVLQTGDVNTGANDGSKFDIILGSNVGHWYGLRLTTQESGMLTVGWLNSKDNWAGYYGITTDDVPVSSFVNETFNLMISMELFDNNGNDIQDLRVKLWFNEILYEGQDLIFTDCGHEVGNKFAVYVYPKTDVKQYVSLRSVHEYQSNPCYYANIAQYRKSTGYTYPEVEGKIFAGWYTDEDYTQVLDWRKTSGAAYAKFTDDEVLRVKAQVALDDNNQIPTDETTLRFVTTVDSLMYNRIGFKYQVEGENVVRDSYNSYTGTYEPGKNPANMVYKKMYYVGNNDRTMSYEPDAFSWKSEYFKAWSLTDIQASQYNQDVKITPYWITKDGTLVLGEEREICVNDSATVDTSASVTIDFLGQNTMPIAGYGMWTASDLDGSDKNIFPDVNREMYFEMFADAGINLINYGSEDYATNPSDVLKQLEYGTKYGLGVFVNDSQLLSINNADALSERLKEYSLDTKYESFSGIFLVDEPTTSNYGYSSDRTEEENRIYTRYKSAASLLNTNFENTDYLTYCNLFPIMNADSNWWEDLWSSSDITDTDKNAYKSHIATINDELNAKVISYDYYPFEDSRLVNDKYDLNLYFWNLDVIRTQAINKRKPFWAYVQAGSQWKNYKSKLSEDDNASEFTMFNGGYLKKEAFDEYYPSESQFNWIVNTSLAFGAQGIQYYPLIQPIQHAYDGVDAEYDFEVNGVLSAWGGKTQWYYYAQEINKHIAEIDEVLMNAKTQKVVYGTENAKTQTKDLTDSCAANYGVLNSVTGDALVGYFNYGGKVALYVANNQHFAVGETARQQNVTLNLSNDYPEITMYDNAKKSVIATSNKQVTLTMDAGEGILLVLDKPLE